MGGTLATALPAVQRRKDYSVSEINGDKARFARERKKKALRRKRNRELKKVLGTSKIDSSRAVSRPSR
jgi:hypothetical protein